MRIVVGITGASGSVYGLRLIEVLKESGCQVHLVVTDSGWQVLSHECGLDKGSLKSKVDALHDVGQIGASIASGSFPIDAMAIAPCSMKTLGGIACGISDNLLLRAADVAIKEGRPLVIVPREMPFSAIHLENMLKLARLGVKIMPACPGFYHRPARIEDMVDMVVGKICDMLNIDHALFQRWTGNE